MAFRMTRYVDISAERALREIQSIDGLWRDPHPAASALTHTTVRVRAESFQISVNGFVQSGTILPEVAGTVRATSRDTSVVMARIGARSRSDVWLWMAYGIATAYLALRVSFAIATFIGIGGVVMCLRVRGTDRSITYDDSPLSRLLADHLDAVLAPHLSAVQTESRAPVA